MKQRQQGLTFVEASAVLAVLAVLASMAVPGLREQIQRRQTEGIASELLSDLQFVRTESVARNERLRVTFGRAADGGSCYVIHSGAAGACSCSVTPACSDSALEFKSVRFAATAPAAISSNVASIVYDPRHGTSTPAATLRITGRDGMAIHQIVNIMGRVRSCTPAGAIAGYRAC